MYAPLAWHPELVNPRAHHRRTLWLPRRNGVNEKHHILIMKMYYSRMRRVRLVTAVA